MTTSRLLMTGRGAFYLDPYKNVLCFGPLLSALDGVDVLIVGQITTGPADEVRLIDCMHTLYDTFGPTMAQITTTGEKPSGLLLMGRHIFEQGSKRIFCIGTYDHDLFRVIRNMIANGSDYPHMGELENVWESMDDIDRLQLKPKLPTG